MEYLSVKNAADSIGISTRRIQQMCQKGEIKGAVKKNRTWRIPSSFILANDNKKRKPLPIGVSDFKVAVSNYYYVDKTLLIRDFLDTKPLVSLYMRPRRFGKTLNMDMLRVFFEKTEGDTSIYFKDKKIWQCGDYYTQHQGQYPVIFLTFKDAKYSTWEETFQIIRKLIAQEYIRHNELEKSSKLNEYEKEQYRKIASEKVDEVDCQMSLGLLSLLLDKHYGKECIIIIDEYDTPIQQGHSHHFYQKTINFMRNFFFGGLKDNSHLAYGFLTGILRVAKESIFSGMNNLKINSILDDSYSSFFGFTKEEVIEMLTYYEKSEKYQEICTWYDGYRFGNTDIFNPWSVINYISDNCIPKAFWQSTGSNDCIGEIVSLSIPEIAEGLYKLLQGEKITTYIDTSVIYPEVKNSPYSIYSFLLVAGYLKVSHIYPEQNGNSICDVTIPNKEIAFVYKKEILSRYKQNNFAISISEAIFSKDSQKLQSLLESFMVKSISFIDTANESFYHGMMLGLCAALGDRYQVKSNRESGLGRFDLQLKPIEKILPGFIFEFKHTNDTHVDLTLLAENALKQIDEKKYCAEMYENGIRPIIKIGIAFRGKSAVVKRSVE